MVDEKIIDQIIDRSIKNQGKEEPIIDKNDLKTLLDVGFQLSFEREESQFIRARFSLVNKIKTEPLKLITYVPRAEISSDDQLGVYRQDFIKFEKEIDFNTKNLAKIALAFDTTNSSILVKKKMGNYEKYVIWGISILANKDRALSRFADVPQFPALPHALTITIHSPASIIISVGERSIGKFLKGEFFPSIQSPLSTKFLGGYFFNRIKYHQGYKEFGNLYWHHYRDLLEILLTESSRRSHGGTIIWLHNQTLGDIEHLLETNTTLENSSDVTSYLCELLRCGDVNKLYEKWLWYQSLLLKRRIVEHIEFLAQLTCIDGALIITDHMKPISFGSILRNNGWNGKIAIGPGIGDFQSNEIDLSDYGTRHRSAVSFVGSCENCITFVISEEGPVRGILKVNEKEIYWWPDCLKSVL